MSRTKAKKVMSGQDLRRTLEGRGSNSRRPTLLAEEARLQGRVGGRPRRERRSHAVVARLRPVGVVKG
jgi:RNA-splicing ligase RtcB